ncbi:MAG TPA: helix-hairpin-helix domain-containing protein [Patescibacteria group bacterium]|nr:helix-hairpin-helix domain-containing protein [Patescibacteria group bacterium]
MENLSSFNFDELFIKFRTPILVLLTGLILTACGIIYFKNGGITSGTKVEVLNATTSAQINNGEITVEVAGEIENPGVYKLPNGSRIDDLLRSADGLSANADRVWTDKYLNRAAKLTDGQKIYIPQSGSESAKNPLGDQTISTTTSSDSNALININTASTSQLDSLPGIGPTYAQNIIEHRPYSTIQELVSKGAIRQSLLDKIKDKISIY